MAVLPDNQYTNMQVAQYDRDAEGMIATDHQHHNLNPYYWSHILGPVHLNPGYYMYGRRPCRAMDFGCGCGRNVRNLLCYGVFDQVVGVDLCEKHIKHCKRALPFPKAEFIKSNGVDLKCLYGIAEPFDFIMSTIVFQHICVRDIRQGLLAEIARWTAHNGIFSLQMGFGNSKRDSVDYFDNNWEATGTNAACDTRVEDKTHLFTDLESVGFEIVDCAIVPSWSDSHDRWIIVHGKKS